MSRKSFTSVGSLDKYLNWLKVLKNASKKHLIVCQTKRDRDVMKSFGCKNVVYPLKPEIDFVDFISAADKPVILLYNIGPANNKKCEKMCSLLQQNGVKVNTRFRKLLFSQNTQSVSAVFKAIHKLAGTERVHASLPF